ncbi:MAG: hypothetical protein JXM79_04865 [Sedimentisphaerales bacterium]|nr:hypothetical protein [Sedimentisphaerales bacterium]
MNLPNINFKEILGKLSVIKNNMALLVPIIIVFVAALLFVPTYLISRRLQKRIQAESFTKGASVIKRLKAEPISGEQYQIELARQTDRANDANEIARLALQTTQRELLSYDIFPEPDPNADFSAVIFRVFGERFRNGIDALVRDVNGRDCPTLEELQRALEESSVSRSRMGGRMPMMDMGGLGRGGMGMGMGDYYGSGMMPGSNVNSLIIDELCESRARSIPVYVDPTKIAGYDYWATFTYEGKDEAIKDCWYSQLGYWVVEDVFDTIEKMNAGHENVLTAPVKRLLSLSFTMGLKRPRAGGGVFRGGRGRRSSGQTKSENADRPVYVLSDKDGLTESCTGRFCDKEKGLHAIHFNVSFVVKATDVLPLMDELCSAKEHQFMGYPDGKEPAQTFKHNQITVLESKIGFVNPREMNHRNYRYGEGNAVELDLICEYLFKVEAYKALVPKPVQDTLDGVEETK